jgi:isoaspartyl peptidase/L-asparaginase-like protein (Ntn-hydrolase superfamily)
MKDTINGYGGAIAIDKNGNFGKATNSAVMLWASIKDDELEYGMEKKKILVTDKFKQNKQ